MDASTVPDDQNQGSSIAGIGIFFLPLQATPTQAIDIKAVLLSSASVLMAEAVGLALAYIITQRLNFQGVHFLSDNASLVSFLRQQDTTNQPDWTIKPYTQAFINTLHCQGNHIHKISRSLNTTADALARQAFQAPVHHNHLLQVTCSYNNHVTQCPLLQALHHVDLHNVHLLAARCY